MEGLTLVIRDCLSTSGVTPTELRVCGGGAVNAIWLQLIADITGVPVLRSTDTEVGAKGAFLVGLVATGGAARVEDVSSWYVRIRDTFTPDPQKASQYSELYEDFLSLRTTVSQTWPRLAAMRGRSPQTKTTDRLPVIVPERPSEGSDDLTVPGKYPATLEGTS
jgi:xylulokinase